MHGTERNALKKIGSGIFDDAYVGGDCHFRAGKLLFALAGTHFEATKHLPISLRLLSSPVSGDIWHSEVSLGGKCLDHRSDQQIREKISQYKVHADLSMRSTVDALYCCLRHDYKAFKATFEDYVVSWKRAQQIEALGSFSDRLTSLEKDMLALGLLREHENGYIELSEDGLAGGLLVIMLRSASSIDHRRDFVNLACFVREEVDVREPSFSLTGFLGENFLDTAPEISEFHAVMECSAIMEPEAPAMSL